MNISFKILGLTFWAALAPVAASAQSLGPADPSPDGTSVSSIPNGTPAPADSNAPDINANPFAGAAGANKFYQDNSLTGAAPQPNNVGILGGGLGSSAQSWATTP